MLNASALARKRQAYLMKRRRLARHRRRVGLENYNKERKPVETNQIQAEAAPVVVEVGPPPQTQQQIGFWRNFWKWIRGGF